MAAQKASLAGSPEAEQTPEAQTPADSGCSALPHPSSISVPKLPAWPLAQPVAAQDSCDHDLSSSQSFNTTGKEHAHASNGTMGSSQARQLDCENDGCEALVQSLSISEGPDRMDGEQSGTAAQTAQEDSDAGTGSAAGNHGSHKDLEPASEHPDQQKFSSTEAAVLSRMLDQAAAEGDSQTEEQGTQDTASADEPFVSAAANGTSHDLRDRASASEELIGRELYVRASLLNHSCRPNCVVVRSMTSGSVRALRDIEVSPPANIAAAVDVIIFVLVGKIFLMWHFITPWIDNTGQSFPALLAHIKQC